MGGEEGSYKVRILPEVNRIEVSWIIWTGKKVMDSFGVGSAGQDGQLGVREAFMEWR